MYIAPLNQDTLARNENNYEGGGGYYPSFRILSDLSGWYRTPFLSGTRMYMSADCRSTGDQASGLNESEFGRKNAVIRTR